MLEQLTHLIVLQYMRSGGSFTEIDWNRSTTFNKSWSRLCHIKDL